MQYGEEGDFVCMIEFPVLNGTIGGIEILARIEAEMYQFGGIPHWGQYNHVGVGNETLDTLYPKFSAAGWRYTGNFAPTALFKTTLPKGAALFPDAIFLLLPDIFKSVPS